MSAPSTFIVIADPQLGYKEDGVQNKGTPQEVRKEMYSVAQCRDGLSSLNVALNELPSKSWPPNGPDIKLSVSGTIGNMGGVFIAGDLTQDGGGINGNENNWMLQQRNPSNYEGGDHLQDVRALYDPWHGRKGTTQPDVKIGPRYVGLGNHDFMDRSAGSGWRFFNKMYSGIADFYRYQMWNFVTQMHMGYKDHGRGPRYSVASIDCPDSGSYDWRSHSLNYRVDLGPVDVYQLHHWGGYDVRGRAPGLDWLRRQLADRGYQRPIIIVQHVPLQVTQENNPKDLDSEIPKDEQRVRLLEILLPYNVLAICVGHIHSPGPGNQPNGYVDWPNGYNTFPAGWQRTERLSQVLAGGAMYGYLAMMRVDWIGGQSPATLNVLFGRNGRSPIWDPLWHEKNYPSTEHAQDGIYWRCGWNKTFNPWNVYVREIEVVYSDEELKNKDCSFMPTVVTEIGNQGEDINKGHGGSKVYIRPLLTTNRTQAVSVLRLSFQEADDKAHVDLFKGTNSGERCYVEVFKNPNVRPVAQIFLWRSQEEEKTKPAGFSTMTENINGHRGGDFLYLLTKTAEA